jgi:UDP-N-acetylglucosamine--N-acetylmuramyl-(pentapeptide) pyrophosphoryl-undecaprenol N-acetylglucosamine transferase
MTTAELCWFRLPSVLVPYPYAAGGHQRLNALELTDAGAARLVPQEEAGSLLWGTAEDLLEDADARSGMSRALAELMPENPAYRIARRLLQAVEEGRRA